jgi:CMP-N-acetylneuraminic acid synthetase
MFSARRVEGYVWRVDGPSVVPMYTRRVRRQEHHGHNVEENGSMYLFKPEVLFANNDRLGGNIGCYEMHPLDSYQIDEPQDVPLIESLIRLRIPDDPGGE